MTTMTPAQLTKLAVAALEDVKGTQIEIIDVAPLTSIADHMVICTGTSNRHVKALADNVLEKAREAGVRAINSQGLEAGDWALVDLNGTLVHVMQASTRASYQLEKLWDLGQAKPRLDEPKPVKKAKAKKSAPPKAAAKKNAAPTKGAKSVKAKPSKPTAKKAGASKVTEPAKTSRSKPLPKGKPKAQAVAKPSRPTKPKSASKAKVKSRAKR